MTNLPTSTKTVDRYIPPFYEGQDDAPVYLLRTPSLIERAAFRRDLRAAGATYSSDEDLFEALREGVRAIDPVNRDELLADVDAIAESGIENASGELRARVGEIMRQVRAFYPRFAGLEGDREYFMQVMPIVACRHFLLGWENLDAPFERKNGLTSDHCLQQLPDRDLYAVGFHALSLMNVSETERKNSESRSPSASSPKRTKAEKSR